MFSSNTFRNLTYQSIDDQPEAFQDSQTTEDSPILYSSKRIVRTLGLFALAGILVMLFSGNTSGGISTLRSSLSGVEIPSDLTHSASIVPSLSDIAPRADKIVDIKVKNIATVVTELGTLVYNGGPIIENVMIIPIYWNAQCSNQAFYNNFYSAIVGNEFMSKLSEYDIPGKYTVGTGTRGTPYVDN